MCVRSFSRFKIWPNSGISWIQCRTFGVIKSGEFLDHLNNIGTSHEGRCWTKCFSSAGRMNYGWEKRWIHYSKMENLDLILRLLWYASCYVSIRLYFFTGQSTQQTFIIKQNRHTVSTFVFYFAWEVIPLHVSTLLLGHLQAYAIQTSVTESIWIHTVYIVGYKFCM
jgi:hypothetical protein